MSTNLPTAAELRDSSKFTSATDHYLEVAKAFSARCRAVQDRVNGATIAGRELQASEARDQRADLDQADALTALMSQIEQQHPGSESAARAQLVDRRGVVAPQNGSTGRNDRMPILAADQPLTSWPSVRDSARDDDEPVRLGSLIRAMVSGRREGMNASEIRALSEGTSGAGGIFVPAPTSAAFIDRARAASRVVQAGARTVPMDTQTLKIPRLTGSTAPAWRLENAAVATGDMTFDSVSLTAKSMAFLVKVSRELIEDADPDIVGIVENDLAAQVASEIDRVALRGSGTDPEPRGVLNTTGVTITSLGANGAPLTYDAIIDGIQVVRGNNFEPNAIVTTPRAETSLAKSKDSAGNYLLQPSVLDDVRRLTTTTIPTTLTVGTSTDASELYLGQWDQLLLGVRTGPLYVQLIERFADFGQVGILVWYRGDVAVAQSGAFNVITGVRP